MHSLEAVKRDYVKHVDNEIKAYEHLIRQIGAD